MKRIYLILLLALLLVSSIMADAIYTYGGVFYYNGTLTTPDSLRVYYTYYPSTTAGSFLSGPTSGEWDSTVTVLGNSDNYVILRYHIYFGDNLIIATEQVNLRLDTNNVTPEVLALIGDSVRVELERANGYLWGLAWFWASQNNALMIYWPRDGSAPKDSVQVFNSVGTLMMTIHYKHSNINTVMDSTLVIHQ